MTNPPSAHTDTELAAQALTETLSAGASSGRSGDQPDQPTQPPSERPPTLIRAAGATIGVLGRYALVVALAALVVAFSIALPETFFTTGNLHAIIDTQAVLFHILALLIAAMIIGNIILA